MDRTSPTRTGSWWAELPCSSRTRQTPTTRSSNSCAPSSTDTCAKRTSKRNTELTHTHTDTNTTDHCIYRPWWLSASNQSFSPPSPAETFWVKRRWMWLVILDLWNRCFLQDSLYCKNWGKKKALNQVSGRWSDQCKFVCSLCHTPKLSENTVTSTDGEERTKPSELLEAFVYSNCTWGFISKS